METILQYLPFDPGSAWFLPMILMGLIIGLILNIIAFMVLSPLFIGILVNNPEGLKPGEKSGFHLFTYIEEGKVKIIVKGDLVVRMIMEYADHKFARQGKMNAPEHWDIIPAQGESEDPLYGIHPLFYLWAWYVFQITGAVFTGIYPFQTVREYTLERTKMHRTETPRNPGDPDTSLQGSNITLVVEEDISDHYRARQFLYPIRIAAADTRDKISVNIILVIKARVVNPHKAAFGTDRWDIQLVNLVTNAVTNYTRTHNLEEVLSALSTEQAGELNKFIEDGIVDDEEHYGIDIDGVDIIDISPNLSAEEKAQLHAEALAKSEKNALALRGEGNAAAIRAINEANQAGGEHALETVRYEALVRAAEAAKGGTVILPMGGGTNDAMLSAILAELKKRPNA